jgi:hypothetical protein
MRSKKSPNKACHELTGTTCGGSVYDNEVDRSAVEN